MSKPDSGHFKDTTGSNVLKHNCNKENGLFKNAENNMGLDLRPHPTKFKQPSSKKMKEFRDKVEDRTITRKEYRRMEWYDRFSARRRTAINLFWTMEKERLLSGKRGSRNWSAEQIYAIINNKRPRYKGKSIESHHLYSASKYPHLADLPQFIVPVTHHEHFKGYHGGNYRKSLPGRPIKHIKDF